jgi:hypothetical protein
MEAKEIYKQLAEPFAPNELEWRSGGGTNTKDMKQGDECKVLVFTYVQARAIQNRLDQVMGIENWCDEYTAGPAGGVICSLSLRIGGEWINKQGMAENTQVEAVKGGESDAFKRAAYKWSIGRYLYDMPEKWCRAIVKGKGIVLAERPSMPEWAYPYDWDQPKERPNEVVLMLSPSQQSALSYKETPAFLAGASKV